MTQPPDTTEGDSYQTERGRVLAEIFEAQRAGLPPHLIELTEKQVFPHLIPCSIRTGRDARRTGTLLGLPAPRFVKRGKSVRYRYSDVLEWLESTPSYHSTSEANDDGRPR